MNEERRVWVTCTDCPAQVFQGEQAEVWVTVASLTDSLLVPEIAIDGLTVIRVASGWRNRVT